MGGVYTQSRRKGRKNFRELNGSAKSYSGNNGDFGRLKDGHPNFEISGVVSDFKARKAGEER
jgi:hypothetical protein